ncbi:transcription initiation factor IIF, beta subunit-domain-containing protein [Vararia minispora EC-137]|uniref:Transcription initiation factor IIF, beta subunit-domain-containing protein n=1 Tax=Vararia minispora EC-137 TaxID=1314806 RepID=A0ACB8QUN0_9AGAM|nr:transcription initiation factor IIF, beta subunit-domain-containing protein [Vararia minispora EC-137]
MDSTMKDEEKPFDLGGPQDDDQQPDPEEHIMLDSGSGRVWLVKIPRFLMERWAAIQQDGIDLATIRIYDDKSRGAHTPPRMFVEAPADPFDPSKGVDLYELDMHNQDVENQIVVAEREKDPSQPTSRARTTIMTGKVKHECNLRPTFTERYRERVKNAMEASLPQKRVRMIDEVAKGTAGKMAVNRLTSGVTSAAGFAELTRPKQKPPKGQFERMARMARNQLLDLLFETFKERPYWPIKVLRERTQQPEAYLKDVLNSVATLHRSGEHNGMWELRPEYKPDESGVSYLAALQELLAKQEPDDVSMDFDEEEEEEEDMEEVA